MTIFDILNRDTGLPCVYSHFKQGDKPKAARYLVYIGTGQQNFEADNTYYHSRKLYQLEYYFKTKDESKEAEIENILLQNGYLYSKSEDVFIESEGLFVIYYNF